MNEKSEYLKEILKRIKFIRQEKGISKEDLEKKLILGPGWIENFENGDATFSIDAFLAIVSSLGISLNEIISDIDKPNLQKFPRYIYAVESEEGINIKFQYAKYDATYYLKNATVDEFNSVILELRNGLSRLIIENTDSEQLKTEAVATAFLRATKLWPKANPSDIWWFIIYRAYCDPFNHPAMYSRLSFEQSWKRTGGWALEVIFVRHYSPALKKVGIHMFIAPNDERDALIAQANINDRLEADKADIFLTGDYKGEQVFFGIVHVKASFAERRTDDVPMSLALVKAGYVSPLLTMDCKSTPSNTPYNKGELGGVLVEGNDTRSAKRKDFEKDGYFSACFSYNRNTRPTPKAQQASGRIFCCDFNSPNDDEFYKFIVNEWQRFQSEKMAK